MKNTIVSQGLFAEPSFAEGVARILDLGTTLQQYNSQVTEEEADIEALKSDWRVVGDDLKFSIKNYERGVARPA